MLRRSIIGAGLAGPVFAQDRPVRMIVPFAPGAAADLFARRLATRMQAPLGQPVLVESRPGGGGTAAALEVVRARPDGQTILFGTVGTLALYPLLVHPPRFDPMTDLAPVSVVGAATLAFAVRPELASDLAGFVAATHARPGAWSFGSPVNSSFLRLAMELLKREAGNLDLPHMPPRSGGSAVADLVQGRVQAISDTAMALLEHHRGGRVRILAFPSARRSPLDAGVPTVAEAANLPGFEAAAWMAVMLPIGVLASMRDRLAYAINSTMADVNLRAELGQAGFEVGALLSPPEIIPFMLAEQAKWRPIVQAISARRK